LIKSVAGGLLLREHSEHMPSAENCRTARRDIQREIPC